MESGDAEVFALDSHMETPAELEPLSSSPSVSAPHISVSSESLNYSSSRDPESTTVSDNSSSAERLTTLSHDFNSPTFHQLLDDPPQGSVCCPSLQKALSVPTVSSPPVLTRDLESPSIMENSSIEQNISSLEASPWHLQDVPLPEQLWQDPCNEPRAFETSSVLEGGSQVEEALTPSSNPESSLSNTSTLGLPPPEACSQEDSSCMGEEQELSDDVKRQMLADVCKGVSILSCNSEAPGGHCSVYIIGTAHVSEESCREVQAAVHLIKPQVVFLELCHKRTAVLQRTSLVVPTVSNMITMWKQRKTNMLGIVYSWFLAKVAAKLEIRPGSEFRAAYEEALVCGAKVVLGDRDIEVTLRRTWGKMSAWHKTKLIFLMIYQSLFLPKADQLNELIEKLKDADILTIAFEELGKFSPVLMETLINERDMFMTAALQKIAEHHSSIVAVVGRGHVAGITNYWGQDIPIQTLLEIPGRRSVLGLRLRTYAVIASVAVASVVVFALR